MSLTEKLVERTFKEIGKNRLSQISAEIGEPLSEYAFPKLVPQLEKRLQEFGAENIHKTLKREEKILKEHLDKLSKLKYRSAVESQIRKHEKTIQTIKAFIKNSGL